MKLHAIVLVMYLLLPTCLSQYSEINQACAKTECQENTTRIDPARVAKKSRKKRFIYFPNGSNFVATLSTVKALLVQIPNLWNLVMEFDVLFHLPTEQQFFKKVRHKHIKRRQRRELWREIEDNLLYHNLDGESCIIKAICEAENELLPRGTSMVQDIIRMIFRVSDEYIENNEDDLNNDETDVYMDVIKGGRCAEYNEKKCPISLIDILLSFTQNNINVNMF